MKNIGEKSKKEVFFPLRRLFPNIVTIIAICFGLTSIRYALKEQWEIAVAFIIIAGFLDVLDGRLARFLKATSNFGAQLDSLADFVNFGVAPAIIIYLWELNKIPLKGLGWSLVLFYAICSAIRLARFNSDLAEEDRPAWREGFFTGVPAPMGAYLALLPMIVSFESDFIKVWHPLVIGLYLGVIGILMASRLPTFATKKIAIPKQYISIFLVCFGVIVGVIIIQPWSSLSLLGVIYIFSFPFSIRAFKRLSSKDS